MTSEEKLTRLTEYLDRARAIHEYDGPWHNAPEPISVEEMWDVLAIVVEDHVEKNKR